VRHVKLALMGDGPATSIVIVRSLPVLQCRQCGDAELENVAMSRVDRLLAAVDRSAELEVVRCAA
jgi:hypothetical protein